MTRPSGVVLTAWAAAFAAGLFAFSPVRRHVAAATVLMDLAAPAIAPSAVASGTHTALRSPVRTVPWILPDAVDLPARLYVPDGPVHRCAVIGHGVHHLGIEEPRLVRFATELARTGVLVGTPELSHLAAYRIVRDDAVILARAVHALSETCPAGARVGLIGFSFAGGLSLLAAEEPATGERLAYVASVGGYQDLSRVLRFLLGGVVEGPAGNVPRKPHEYGAVVLLYGYIDRFVSADDLEVMAPAVQAWLQEDRSRAWSFASLRTAPEAERLFMRLANGRIGEMQGDLSRVLAEHQDELRAMSPAGHLRRIPVPVYLLHGSGDSVIPPEEAEWGERELQGMPHRTLVTPLLEHVGLAGTPAVSDALALVDFMSLLL